MNFEPQKILLQELSGYLAQKLQKIKFPSMPIMPMPILLFMGGKWALMGKDTVAKLPPTWGPPYVAPHYPPTTPRSDKGPPRGGNPRTTPHTG